jgi:transcriptional regulator with XRE-family HTH domain
MATGAHKTKLRQALADTLRRARLNRKLSQEKIASLCGLHRTHISLLERGEKSPTVDTLERVANALGEKPSALLAVAEQAAKAGGSHD